MTYEKSCGAVVFTRINGEIRYVLVQQVEGFHGFPKGHMEEGETEEETALREIYEEVGLRVKLIEGFRAYEEHPLPKKPGVMKQVVYFLAEYEDQTIVYQQEEVMAAPVLPYEEAMNCFEYENNKRILKEANEFLTRK